MERVIGIEPKAFLARLDSASSFGDARDASELQRAMQKLKTAPHSVSVADPWVRRRFRSIADAIDRAAVEIERTHQT